MYVKFPLMGRGMIKVLEGLYLGNLIDSRCLDRLRSNNITHVISVYENPRAYFSDITYLCITAEDSQATQLIDSFAQCVEFIHNARASGGGVLVHCIAGVSRSVTIVSAYLLAVTDLDYKSVLQVLENLRPISCPNYGFRKQLRDWSKQELRELKKLMKLWPPVYYDDQAHCKKLLNFGNPETYKPCEEDSFITSPPAVTAYSELTDCQPEHKAIPKRSCLESTGDSTNSLTDSGDNSTDNHQITHSDCSTSSRPESVADSSHKVEEAKHIPIIMGNTNSQEETNPNYDSQKLKKSKIQRMRTVLRNVLNNKDGERKKKALSDGKNYNNNDMIAPPTEAPFYTESYNNVPRSATLPAYTPSSGNRGVNIDDLIVDRSATMQVRRLPAYNNSGIVGNIQNRQRIMSTPTYTQRPRTSSQNSSYTRRYSSQTRVVSTHIPDHLEKKLVRSRSTGVISEAEIKMQKTPSASVVKLSECEDWIV